MMLFRHSQLISLFLLMISGAFRLARGFSAANSRPVMSISSNNKSKGGTNIIFHWFRNGDLRLHDNPALVHSTKQLATRIQKGGSDQTYVIPFYCFDPKVFGNDATSRFGSLKCGPRRAKFVAESVKDLQSNLSKNGSGLLVSYGREPQEFMAELIRDISDTVGKAEYSMVCQEEPLKEETDAVKAMQSVLPPKTKIQSVWGSTMYELNDLPFGEDLGDMPNTFTPFRNKVEKRCEIATPLGIPSKELKHFSPTSNAELMKVVEPHMQEFPSLEQLGYDQDGVKEANTVDPRGVMEFKGGETAALARVQDYIFTKDRLRIYFDTRNGMLGADYSTKFSPWLAHGTVSPRFIAKECQRYEQERGIQNKSTYWVVFELLWRDYCKFFCLKHGNRVFYPGGILTGTDQAPQEPWKVYEPTLEAWKEGKTGYPLVDANMREMKATGFMSNRGRQNVCSFLCLDLKQDWRRGGDYFETLLLDYDVYSNWYNWCAGAGMTGGRINRFNIVKQSKDYDQHGEYVRHWCPELKNVPNEFVHEPWKMTQFQQKEFGVILGVDYPHRLRTTAPPQGNDRRGGSGQSNKKQRNGRNNNGGRGGRDRRANSNNRHQAYEMKSLKVGRINMKNSRDAL